MVEAATRLTVVRCAGAPYEVGLQHGKQAANLIHQGIGAWKAGLRLDGETVDAYLSRFLANTGYVETIERLRPDALEEIRGIADGAGVPFEDVLVYNLMDEEWTFRAGYLDSPGFGCTAIAVAGVGIGQTMDIPTWHDGTQIVLAINPDDGPAKRAFTAAGMLNLNGANAAGVGMVVNNLSQLLSSDNGLPVMMVIHGILGSDSAETAARWVESVTHAVGQHYLICDPTRIVSLEATAHSVSRVPVGERYVHANHPVLQFETRPETVKIESASNTYARAARATELSASIAELTGIQDALADRQAPISCDRTRGSMSFGGTAIGPGVPPVMRVAPGPPHETPWQDVSWV